MKVKYLQDTDTLLVDFSDRKVAETRDLNENVLLELDEDGHVVSMTLEHARQQTDVTEFSYQLADLKPEPGVLAARDRKQRDQDAPRRAYTKTSGLFCGQGVNPPLDSRTPRPLRSFSPRLTPARFAAITSACWI